MDLLSGSLIANQAALSNSILMYARSSYKLWPPIVRKASTAAMRATNLAAKDRAVLSCEAQAHQKRSIKNDDMIVRPRGWTETFFLRRHT